MIRSRYLRPEDIRRLQALEFAPRVLAEGNLSGRHRSRQRGASIEFHEYREYAPGDDPAQVDWRVFARTDRHYLRTFEQETHLECHLFLDSSASMGFRGGGDQSKLDYASVFAAALSYLAVTRGDRISLGVFDEALRDHRPPGSTRQHLDGILRAMEENEARGSTSVAAVLGAAQPMLKRRAVLVVLSDFYEDASSVFSALDPYLHRGFRVHLFQVLTPEELELESRGLATYRDPESGARIVAHSAASRERYREALDAHVSAYRELAARRQVDYVLARTDSDPFYLIDRFVD